MIFRDISTSFYRFFHSQPLKLLTVLYINTYGIIYQTNNRERERGGGVNGYDISFYHDNYQTLHLDEVASSMYTFLINSANLMKLDNDTGSKCI